MTRRSTIAALAACVLASSACAPDRRAAADDIEQSVREMPKVTSTSTSYSSTALGGSYFSLTASLDSDSAPEEVAAVAKDFGELLNRKRFGAFDSSLSLQFPELAELNDGLLINSWGYLDFNRNEDLRPTPAMAESATREWVTTVKSPGVQSARLRQPVWGTAKDTYQLDVTVSPEVTDDQLRTLDQRFQTLSGQTPRLDSLTWVVISGPLLRRDADPSPFARSIKLTGVFPDEGFRRQWTAIVAAFDGHIEAETDMSLLQRDLPPTRVAISVPSGPEKTAALAEAEAALPMLTQLAGPVQVRMDSATFIIGGCTTSDPNRPETPTPLSIALRQQYEKC